MEKSQKEDRDQRRRLRRQNPSFSSSLLDAIYHSIDETSNNIAEISSSEEQLILYKETMIRKKNHHISSTWTDKKEVEEEKDVLNFRRACMVEKWMEEKKKKKIVVRRNSIAEFPTMNSSSSSSESCCTDGRFSSSELEFSQRPKPIRTSTTWSRFPGGGEELLTSSIPKQEKGFFKTKSKASKIYHDLKKVKQPISPGGRLASFLNSLFNGGSPKPKAKFFSNSISTTNYDHNDLSRKSKSLQGSSTTTCSSASSFSRSCLSKTPSSRSSKVGIGNNGGMKRSVRFCPVSVIVDEDCQPCGHKSLLKDEKPDHVMVSMANLLKKLPSKSYRKFEDEEVKGEMFKSYQNQRKINDNQAYDNDDDEEDYDDDDGVSCSSSDLFELDNLQVIGIERFQEELPVYETTHFNPNNCAIATSLVL